MAGGLLYEATPDSASHSLLRLDRDLISNVDIGGVVNNPALDLARGQD
jgi:hypothetical protein